MIIKKIIQKKLKNYFGLVKYNKKFMYSLDSIEEFIYQLILHLIYIIIFIALLTAAATILITNLLGG